MDSWHYTFKNNGLGEFNDDVFDHLFNLTTNSGLKQNEFTILIQPNTKARFWRLGIRLSKTESVEFYHPDHRYKEPGFREFIDIHFGVGDWGNKLWSFPNKLELTHYNFLEDPKHVLNTSESYKEFGKLKWEIKYIAVQRLLYLSYEADDGINFSKQYRLESGHKYFKVFAWADETEFEIDCTIQKNTVGVDIELKNIGRLPILTLANISRINYVVGENRSGKSSLLAGVAHIVINPNHRSYPFQSYLKNDPSSKIKGNAFSSYETEIIDSTSTLSPFYNPNTNSNITGKLPNEALHIMEEMGSDSAGESIGLGKYGYSDSPRARLNLQDAKKSAASGDKTLAYLKQELDKKQDTHSTLTFVIIDEPETHLNPKLHKEIHSFLEDKVKETNNLVFVVATHSSYLIAAAANAQINTKVYCLADGKLISSTAYWTDSTHKNSHLAIRSDGFKPSECKFLVHDILGSTLNSYFPKIFYCENSLKEFISAFLDKSQDLFEKPLIIPSGNDLDTAGSVSTLCAIIEGIRDYYKKDFNFLGSIAYAIVDKLNNLQKKEHALITKVNAKYPGAVIILEEEEIEKSYPDKLVESYLKVKNLIPWDKKTNFKDYLKSQDFNEEEIGIQKSELAKSIGNNISISDFKNNFSKIAHLLPI